MRRDHRPRPPLCMACPPSFALGNVCSHSPPITSLGFWIMRLGARIARLEQRRKMQATKRFSEACTCFPANEQPGFKWRAEAEIAAAVLCPLHGLRFHIVITRDLYRPFRFYITDYKDGWHQSAQYQTSMRTSFHWALWPPQKEKDKEFGQDSVLILRDGTELPSGGSV